MKFFGAALAAVLTIFSVSAGKITLTATDSNALKGGIDLLQEYLEKSTGEKPVLGNKTSDGLNITLELREAMSAEPEAFILEFPAKNQVVIAGGTPLAIRHGVCEFLERFYGIRWLYSGANGEYVPKVTGIPAFPAKAIRQTPTYKVRTFALVHKQKQDYAWAAKNKGIFNYDLWTFPEYSWFHHNMLNLLPAAKYSETHPQFFPIRDGKRLIPGKGENVYWQHCYNAPGIVDELVKVTNASFAKNSKRTSISFGVNDGGRYCECEKCVTTDGKEIDSIGFENRSRSYLNCISVVAEKCAAPGRTFGFLAYSGLREVPKGMKIHSSLRPYITYELLYWADPDRAKNFQRITKEWVQANNSKVGWYDYLELSWFLIPKISLNVIPEALRWGAENGVVHYYAEALPTADWHSGPMLYLILKLTWDPKQNVAALLDDWCKAAVGEKAAPYLKKYYQGCSDFWEKEVPKTAFFKEKKQRQYLGRSSGYLDAVEPEWLDQMKQYLDKAVELATPERKACAEDIRKTFTSREQMIRTYVKNNKLRKDAEKMNFTEAKFYNFDKKNTMWATWQRNTSKGTFSFAPGEGVDNSGAIAMNLTKSYRDMVFMTSLKAVPKRVYRVSGYVRTKGMDGTGYTKLSVAWSAPGKSWLDPAFNASDTLNEDGSFSWRKLNLVVYAPDVPNCSMRIMLGSGNSTKGEVYWDNIKVEEVVVDEKMQTLRKETENRKFRRIGNYFFNHKGHWSTWQRKNSKGTFMYAPGEGIDKSGAQAMNMENSVQNLTFMATFNKIVPKKIYRVSIYVRAKDVDPTAVASLTVAWSAPGKPWLDKSFNAFESVKVSPEWQKLSVVVTAPDVEKCAMRIMLNADKSSKGFIYWDQGAVDEIVEQ